MSKTRRDNEPTHRVHALRSQESIREAEVSAAIDRACKVLSPPVKRQIPRRDRRFGRSDTRARTQYGMRLV